MNCAAIAARSGAPCKFDRRADGELCELHARMRAVGKRVLTAVAPTDDDLAELRENARRLIEATAADSMGNQLDDMFAGLELVDADGTVDEIASAVRNTPIVTDTEKLDSAARAAGVDVKAAAEHDDTRTVDRAAAARAEDATSAVRDMIEGTHPPDRKKIGFYVRLVHNPIYAKSGVDPLSDAEVDDCAGILAEIIGDMRGSKVIQSPWTRLLVWGLTVWGVRYFDRIVPFVMKFVASKRPALASTSVPAPSAAAAAAAAPAPPSAVGRGFGAMAAQ